jgi:hypothetical protein
MSHLSKNLVGKCLLTPAKSYILAYSLFFGKIKVTIYPRSFDELSNIFGENPDFCGENVKIEISEAIKSP